MYDYLDLVCCNSDFFENSGYSADDVGFLVLAFSRPRFDDDDWQASFTSNVNAQRTYIAALAF